MSTTMIDTDFFAEILRGVATATTLSAGLVEAITARIRSVDLGDCSIDAWNQALASSDELDTTSRNVAGLTLAIACLIQKSRSQQPTASRELQWAWDQIRNTLQQSPAIDIKPRAFRSSQGFMAVPLCNIVNSNGDIDVLFRLHVWPACHSDKNDTTSVHSHQPFAQSWILAGTGRDHSWSARTVPDVAQATHAKYIVTWSTEGNRGDQTYKLNSTRSKLSRTGEYVVATEDCIETHRRDMTYTVAAGAFHSSEAVSDTLHATLFLFDGSQGFDRNATVLGPCHEEPTEHVRDGPTMTPDQLARLVEEVRLEEEGRS